MSRLLLAVVLVAAACSAPSGESPTPTTGGATTTTTTFETTEPAPPPTTGPTPEVEIEMQGCGSPPVTFSPLCETYELLETWYVDTPIDPEALARTAVRGLEEFTTTETEEPPRTLFCAIPDSAFAALCETLAERVAESQISVGPAVEAALSYMIDTGLDPFTYYLPPGQTGSVRLNGIVGGVGVVLDARDAAGSKCARITEICQLEIVVVLEDNPGWDAGLEIGDIISEVDRDPVEGKGFAAVVSQIAGDETGVVELTIERDGSHMSFPIERTELEVPTVEYGVVSDNVGYLRIPDFELDIPSLVSDSLEEINAEGVDTLVVDLRDNPGGLVDSVVDTANEFIDGGTIMTTESTAENQVYEAAPGGTATDQRLLVLVNQGTASAAEVLAGALRDRRDAVMVGTNTFGKYAVQIPFTLRNGGEFHVAVARWLTPEGETVGNGGLTPDQEVTWPTGSSVEDIVSIALEANS